MHKQFEESGVASRELIAAQSRLGRAQFEAGGLLISITHLRDLRQTTEIAAHNLRAHRPTENSTALSARSPFARDDELAKFLDQQARHEIAYLESCRERFGEAQNLTALWLQELAAPHARTANWLSVLQTSLLSALLGMFGVAQAFGGFDKISPFRWAVVALVASMALILPPLAARWTNGYRRPAKFSQLHLHQSTFI
jgi:hypothetical protein